MADVGNAAVDSHNPMEALMTAFEEKESGQLTIDELGIVLQSLGIGQDDVLRDMLVGLDTDGDGLVSYDDIKSAMSSFTTTTSRLNRDESWGVVDRESDFPSTNVEAGAEPRDALESYLLQLVNMNAFPQGELTTLLQFVDDLCESIRISIEADYANDRGRCEQAEKDARQLQQSNQVLSDEYQRMEQELAASLGYKRQAEERAEHIMKLKAEIATFTAELAGAASASEEIERLTAIVEQLQAEVKAQETQQKDNLDHIGMLEAAREGAQSQVEAARAERDDLLQELSDLQDRLDTEGFVVKGQNQESDKLSERNLELRARAEEFREIVTMKDEVIAKLRRTIDDQTLLIQSLRLNGTPSNYLQGSLMNEIADFVATESGNEFESKANEPPGSPKTPDRPHPILEGSTVSSAVVPSISKLETKSTTEGGMTKESSDAEQERVSIKESKDDEKNERQPRTSIIDDINLSPFKSPGNMPDFISDRAQDESPETRMNMYTLALKRHAAGLKIVTRESAEGMGVNKLKQLVAILKDLTSARSMRLINALDEREQLENDASVKKRVLSHMIAAASSPEKKVIPRSPSNAGSIRTSTPISPISTQPQTPNSAAKAAPAKEPRMSWFNRVMKN